MADVAPVEPALGFAENEDNQFKGYRSQSLAQDGLVAYHGVRPMDADVQLGRARDAYERRAWCDAYELFSAADALQLLGAEDLHRLAFSAYLTGRDDAANEALEREHGELLAMRDVPAAVRCAFWLGMTLMQRGQLAPGGGWLARAARLLDEADLDCVERGYLLLPGALHAVMSGDGATALAGFEQLAAIADRFADPDLMALGRVGRAQALVLLGDAKQAVPILDETMVAVTTGEVSPIAAGIVYCAMVLVCRDLFDVRRAKEWTKALSRWCDTQQDLRPYRGQCLVHRSEIMQINGEWSEALDEVERACTHLSDPPGDPVLGMARYQQAELLRLRGELDRAEESYRRASVCGHAVEPGLALLRLAQGRVDDALAAIRREVAESESGSQRSRVLAAFVEIALAAGDVLAARGVADELTELAGNFDSAFLRASAAGAHGAVLLAEGDATAACHALRESWRLWQQLDAPYEAARARVLIARACTERGDRDTAALEVEAARSVFEALGATSALDELTGQTPSLPGGLTGREVEVLRLVATGVTNREIADTLVISEKTVSRHLTNMFTKLGVPSRAAATAYAYEHDLIPNR